jgi:hypothetical protein
MMPTLSAEDRAKALTILEELRARIAEVAEEARADDQGRDADRSAIDALLSALAN